MQRHLANHAVGIRWARSRRWRCVPKESQRALPAHRCRVIRNVRRSGKLQDSTVWSDCPADDEDVTGHDEEVQVGMKRVLEEARRNECNSLNKTRRTIRWWEPASRRSAGARKVPASRWTSQGMATRSTDQMNQEQQQNLQAVLQMFEQQQGWSGTASADASEVWSEEEIAALQWRRKVTAQKCQGLLSEEAPR